MFIQRQLTDLIVQTDPSEIQIAILLFISSLELFKSSSKSNTLRTVFGELLKQAVLVVGPSRVIFSNVAIQKISDLSNDFPFKCFGFLFYFSSWSSNWHNIFYGFWFWNWFIPFYELWWLWNDAVFIFLNHLSCAFSGSRNRPLNLLFFFFRFFHYALRIIWWVLIYSILSDHSLWPNYLIA